MTIQQLRKRFKAYFGFNPPIDMITTMLRGSDNASIDIIKLDEMFSQHDAEYDCNKGAYKGKPNYSPAKYVKEKYGEEAYNFINSVI